MPDPPTPIVPGLVSIVVPAYRADRFLSHTLERVRRQQYGTWELLVVEDSSVGETQRLVEAFAETVPERRVVYQRHAENRGPSATRNTALRQVQGEFVAFLDADDLWLETHLTAAVEALNTGAADIAYSSAVTFEDQSERLLHIWGPTPRELEQFPRSLVGRNFVTPSATVVHRRVIEVVGPFDEDPTIQTCEDLDYWLRAVEAGLRFVHVPGCHCLYRKGAAGAGSADPLPIVERQARVLARHRGKGAIPLRDWNRALAYYLMAAGALSLEQDAHQAGRFFFEAWRARPLRVDLLTMSVLCRTIFPFLPNLGIIRRINRAIRPR